VSFKIFSVWSDCVAVSAIDSRAERKSLWLETDCFVDGLLEATFVPGLLTSNLAICGVEFESYGQVGPHKLKVFAR
jgi:hypothetical protein